MAFLFTKMTILSFFRPGKTKGQQLVDLARSTQPRKDEAALRVAFYSDQQVPELLKDLARQFREPSKFQLFFINMVKKVINRLAVVYKRSKQTKRSILYP